MKKYTYTYKCVKCNEVEEHEHERDAIALIMHCGEPMKKIILSFPSIHFKGTGWGGDTEGKQ